MELPKGSPKGRDDRRPSLERRRSQSELVENIALQTLGRVPRDSKSSSRRGPLDLGIQQLPRFNDFNEEADIGFPHMEHSQEGSFNRLLDDPWNDDRPSTSSGDNNSPEYRAEQLVKAFKKVFDIPDARTAEFKQAVRERLDDGSHESVLYQRAADSVIAKFNNGDKIPARYREFFLREHSLTPERYAHIVDKAQSREWGKQWFYELSHSREFQAHATKIAEEGTKEYFRQWTEKEKASFQSELMRYTREMQMDNLLGNDEVSNRFRRACDMANRLLDKGTDLMEKVELAAIKERRRNFFGASV